MKKRLFTAALALAILMGLGTPAFAAQTTSGGMTIQSISGGVSLTDSSGGVLACAEGTTLPDGFTLTTEAESCAGVQIDDTKTIRIDALSSVGGHISDGKSDLCIGGGAVFFNIAEKPSGSEQLSIHTPSMTLVPLGVSSGVLSAAEGIERVEVYDGSARVSFRSGADAVTVLAGQALTLTGDGAEISPVKAGGIPGFAAAEIADDAALRERIGQAAEPQKASEQKIKSSVRTQTPTPDSTELPNMFMIDNGDALEWSSDNLDTLAAGNKITLLGDIGNAENAAAMLEINVSNITLDLNGFTLHGNITVESGGGLEIIDGGETGKIIRKEVVVIENYGTLKIEGGTIEIAEPSASNAPVVIDSKMSEEVGAPTPSLEIGGDTKIVSGSENFNGSTAVLCKKTDFKMTGGSISGARVPVNVKGNAENVNACSPNAAVRLEGGSFEMSGGTIESLGESFAVYLKPYGGTETNDCEFNFTGGAISSARGNAVCYSYGRFDIFYETNLLEKLKGNGLAEEPPAAQICKTVYGSGGAAPFKTVFTAYAASDLGEAFDNMTGVDAAREDALTKANDALDNAKLAMGALLDAVTSITVVDEDANAAISKLREFSNELNNDVIPDYDKSDTDDDVAGVLNTIENDKDIRREIKNIDTLTKNVRNTLIIAHKTHDMAAAAITISSTVKLYGDCAMKIDATVPPDISFTLNGNGHALDLKGSTLEGQVSLGGNLTLTDSSKGQTGTIYYPGEDGSAIIGGSLTLKTGAIDDPGSQVLPQNVVFDDTDAAATLSYKVAGKEIYLHAYKKATTDRTNIDALFEDIKNAPSGASGTIKLYADCVTKGNNEGSLDNFSLDLNGHTLEYGPVVYTITASAGENGSITPNGAVVVGDGEDQAFSIKANADFQIADVLVDGTSVGHVASYTFTNVTKNHTIAATFSKAIPITFIGESATKTYTGNEIVLTDITAEGLQEGHKYEGLSYSAKGTDKGDYTGVFSGDVVIKDGSGNTVTGEYVITRTPGKLTINPQAVTVNITGRHDTKTYDGAEHTAEGFTTDAPAGVQITLKTGEYAIAKRRDVGTTSMGLRAENFEVNTTNYTVTIGTVTDGYITIKRQTIIDDDPPAGGGGGGTPTTPTPPPTTPPVTQPWVNPFKDISEKDWFYDAVKYCNENGLMDGTAADEFKPTSVVSRAEVWQVLANLAGVESDATNAPWYGDAMAWAESVGISDGTDPTGEVTREQLITMLYRYFTLIAKGEFEGGMSAQEFDDFKDVSQWAELAVQWGVTDGIIEGSGNMLNPGGEASRGELAAMLMRFNELLKK